MEVILQQSVEKLGHPGDVVKVSNGYARNYLLPRGIAVVATEGNKKQIEAQRQRLEAAEDEGAAAVAAHDHRARGAGERHSPQCDLGSVEPAEDPATRVDASRGFVPQ